MLGYRHYRGSKVRQLCWRWAWVTWGGGLTIWCGIGGHKPLAHLPRWRRRLLHLPCIRWRLWPRPWNFNGPTAGWRTEGERLRRHRLELWQLLHHATQGLTTERRVEVHAMAERILEDRNPFHNIYG